MVTYDYVCSLCGFEKEEWHGMMEDPEIRCDKCNSIMIKSFKGFKSLNFKLKGLGWTTVGSKDGTQGHHKPISQTEMVVPMNANDVVSESAKKGADKIEIMQKQS